MEVNQQVKDFKFFLETNLKWFEEKLRKGNKRDEWQMHDAVLDWLQVNWELIVEANVCKSDEFLLAYGDGAECNASSDRVRYPEKAATHFIGCTAKLKGSLYDLINESYIHDDMVEFYKFTTYQEGIMISELPFKHVLAKSAEGNDLIFSFDDISFFYCKR